VIRLAVRELCERLVPLEGRLRAERPGVLSFEARALILSDRVLSFEARASPSHLRMRTRSALASSRPHPEVRTSVSLEGEGASCLG
jgi:hypothetical protein